LLRLRRVLHRAVARSPADARRVLGGRDHEPRLAAAAGPVRVEALSFRRSGPRGRGRTWRDDRRRSLVILATVATVTDDNRSSSSPPGGTDDNRSISGPSAVVSPWNPANAVTASRFLTLPFLWWSIDHGHHQVATLCILVCGLLDKV